MKKLLLIACLSGIAAFAATPESAPNTLPADPDAAWKQIEEASKAPPVPADWDPSGPTPEQSEAFEKILSGQSAAVAEKSREFYTRFPDHPKAKDAQAREDVFTKQAIRFGNKELAAKREATLSEDEKVSLKLNDIQRRAIGKRAEGIDAVLKDFEAGLREVMKEYPDNAVPWQAMLSIANNGSPDTQKRILTEIIEAKAADEETVERARTLLKALHSLGRPLELSYTAIDGREVNVQKMKGKVVLVDFWATWCPPCMADLPEVIEVYNKYHEKGFEIVGISLDKSKEALEGVLKRYKMAWPQYFDGQGWGNKFVIEYNISAVPTMWLVDKAGKLRTMNARQDLEKQVQDLLAEEI